MTDNSGKGGKDIKKLMKTNFVYPDPADKNFQSKIFKKREFHYYKLPSRPDMSKYDDIKEYRDNICARRFALHEHQSFLSNFINPDTPYRGILVFHGTGTGKCLEKNQRVLINGKYETMEKLWNQYAIKDSMVIDDENGEWYMVNKNMKTNTLNKDTGKIIEGNAIHFYRKEVNENLRKINLSSGKSIITTQLHPFLKDHIWTNRINVNDTIAVPTTLINSNKKKTTKKNQPLASLEWQISEGHELLVTSEINYEKVISIEEIEYNDYVYDIEVADHHNYVAENILCHNTCAGIAIAEKFKETVLKYNTKIHVLVNGPLIRKSWMDELLKCTGETYLKVQDRSLLLDENERARAKKAAFSNINQYYRFLSYRSFYRKVLGEKIAEKKTDTNNKVKISYRKNEEGEFERDIAVDRIHNLNNSIIIIDEAHNLTGNFYGDALQKIIKNSVNLKIVLLTATPMKNKADDIIELINFIRPPRDSIQRDKVFNSYSNHLMNFKPGGIEYLTKMTRGYISYLRGADPVTFAKRMEQGIKPQGLLFTKIIPCKMLEFQRKTYDVASKEEEDTLDRSSEAVSNFAFPGLTEDRKEIKGYYGTEAINVIIGQLKTQGDLLNKKVAEMIPNFDADAEGQPLRISDTKKTVSGSIMNLKNLKYFSVKFWTTLTNINKLYYGKSDMGARTAFVYSNLVRVGIELFKEVLLQNGWIEYEETGNYNIKPDTVCYFTGRPYRDYVEAQTKGEILSDVKGNPYPPHKFAPAVFLSITGSTSEENMDYIPEEKKQILDNVFSNIENIHGKNLKLVLGSKVMNEGISLKNVAETHILDVHYTLGKVDQVVGRAIRHCSHYNMINDDYRFPEVNVYKYAVVLDKGLSSELDLYRKAEQKYLLVKKVERILKMNAVDCALNKPGNVFKEEVEKFKTCEEPKDATGKFIEDAVCPSNCDYTKCDFQCNDDALNAEYYDRTKLIYKRIAKDKLDTTTFTNALARGEITFAKEKIKEMYRTKEVFKLNDILKYVRANHNPEKKDLFDEFFVFKALDELIPVTENDFNNFNDTILNKFNEPGYLRYVGNYYIFQPFSQNEDVPMYYRSNFDHDVVHKLSLSGYMANTNRFKNITRKVGKKTKGEKTPSNIPIYDFENAMEYYDSRKEFKFVGIIDKEVNRKKNKRINEMEDVFKIREERAKILDKKRGTGIPSLKGAVCATSKQKEYLEGIAKKVGLKIKKDETRSDLCNRIRDKFLELEKYSTGKNKVTYVMIPTNHQSLPFPYNLEDRVEYIKEKIAEQIKFKININVSKKDKKYTITIKDEDKLKDFHKLFKKLGGNLEKNKWVFNIE